MRKTKRVKIERGRRIWCFSFSVLLVLVGTRRGMGFALLFVVVGCAQDKGARQDKRRGCDKTRRREQDKSEERGRKEGRVERERENETRDKLRVRRFNLSLYVLRRTVCVLSAFVHALSFMCMILLEV